MQLSSQKNINIARADSAHDVIVTLIYMAGILTVILFYPSIKVRKMAKIRNRYNQVLHLTQDTTWESNKNTIKHHKQVPRGQLFPSR